MLILTRRVGETLIIGDKEIQITVLGVKGCQVRLGVQAPKEVPVHREEIFLRIQAEKKPIMQEKNGSPHPAARDQTEVELTSYREGNCVEQATYSDIVPMLAEDKGCKEQKKVNE